MTTADRRRAGRASTLSIVTGLATLVTLLAGTPAAHANRQILQSASSWVYQLRAWNQAITSSADVAVVDPSARTDLARLKKKPDGARRATLAYLELGEAEPWRNYWADCCSGGRRPSWLTNRTQGWANNFIVRFWEPEWKAIVLKQTRDIMRAGFDGLYLDRVDTWENIAAPRGVRGGARAAMIRLVREVAAAARAINPDAAIMVQNGEELLGDDVYLATIDGIAKESLITGNTRPGHRNSERAIAASMAMLKRAKAKGKAVLVVEYMHGAGTAAVDAELRRNGFVPNFTDRAL